MLKYAYNPNPKNSVKVYGRGLRLSVKSSKIVCSNLTGKPLDKGKRLLEDLLKQKRSINGKYYTNASKEILTLLKLAEGNADLKPLDTDRCLIHASAHTGTRFWRPRQWRLRRTKRKVANIQIVLVQK